jgi:hypothetical protein
MDILYFSRHTLLRSSTNQSLVESFIENNCTLVYLTTYNDVKENRISSGSNFEHAKYVLPHNSRLNKLINYLYSSVLLVQYSIKFRPKLVIIHDSVYAPALFVVKFFLKVPIGVHFHEIIWDCGFQKNISLLLRIQEKLILGHLSITIFPSERRRKAILGMKANSLKSIIWPNYIKPSLNYHSDSSEPNCKVIYFGAVNSFILNELTIAIEDIRALGIGVDIYAFGNKLSVLKFHFANYQNIRFFDPLPFLGILKVLPTYLASICVYEPTNMNNILCEPRKMYDSVLSGLPVITNDIEAPPRLKNYCINLKDLSLSRLYVLRKKTYLDSFVTREVLIKDYDRSSEEILDLLELYISP